MFTPGSFSKNIGWGDQGLQKLRSLIKQGFNNELNPIPRSDFQKNCNITNDIGAYLERYFLKSQKVDGIKFFVPNELVIQAFTGSDIKTFDYLSFFTLILNCDWINSFFRNTVWKNGEWSPKELSETAILKWINENISGTSEVRKKCFTNLRFILENTYPQYKKGSFDRSKLDLWVSSSFFLVWDNYLIEHEVKEITFSEAIKELLTNEVYKILGTEAEYISEVAGEAFENYMQSNYMNRIHSRQSFKEVSKLQSKKPQKNSIADLKIRSLPVERQLLNYLQQIRDKSLARNIKEEYKHRCLFCEKSLIVAIGPEMNYSEAAHVKSLGNSGPDSKDNLIVLCPEHHIQFDRGLLAMILEKGQLKLMSKLKDGLNGKVLKLKKGHELNVRYIDWHRSNIYLN